MKQFFLFVFVLIFPFLFALWWIGAVCWQLVKNVFLYVKKEYLTAQEDFRKL